MCLLPHVGVSVASSVLTITVLSLDRYLAIRHPMAFRTFSNGKHTVKIILSIWTISFGIMVPLILVRKLHLFDLYPPETLHFCKEEWVNMDRRAYDVFLFVFMFVIPGCFVVVSYSMIGKRLWSEGKTLHRGDSKVGQQQAEKIMSGRRRVARMLVVLAILFAICWMPYQLLSLYIDFVIPRVGEGPLETLPFTILLGHSNSALNPILYCFMNKTFRKCAFKILKCRKTKPARKPPDNPVSHYADYPHYLFHL